MGHTLKPSQKLSKNNSWKTHDQKKQNRSSLSLKSESKKEQSHFICACSGRCPLCSKEIENPSRITISGPSKESEQQAEEAVSTIFGTSPRTVRIEQPKRAPSSLPISSKGQPLDIQTQRFFESTFDTDFSEVKVHNDSTTNRFAQSLNARAFTTRNHLGFSKGAYRPQSSVGRRLIAHELVHVLQQTTSNFMNMDSTSNQIIQLSEAEEIIDKHSGWINLREEKLGKELLTIALRNECTTVNKVLDELGTLNRDDVSLTMIKAASDSDLRTIANTPEGSKLLSRAYDELSSGHYSEKERAETTRIVQAKKAGTTEKSYREQVKEAVILPFRLPGLTVYHDAPISAKRMPGGKIWVYFPSRVAKSKVFADEVASIKDNQLFRIFTAGVELDENEIIGIKMYDLGGVIHYRPALYLIQLSNETVTTAFKKMAEAGAIGLTLGVGLVAGAGVKGASIGARVLLWADRVGTAVSIVNTVFQEHKGWIIQRFGKKGEDFLKYLNYVDSAFAIFGAGKTVVEFGKLIYDLKSSYGKLQRAIDDIEDLDASELEIVSDLESKAERVLKSFDTAKDLRRAAKIKKRTATAPTTPSAPEAAPVQVGRTPPKVSKRKRAAYRKEIAKKGPAKIEKHHLIPQELTKKKNRTKLVDPSVSDSITYGHIARRLKELNIDIDRHIVGITRKLHSKKGIHKGLGGGIWNQRMLRWFARNPNFTKRELMKQIRKLAKKLEIPMSARDMRKYGRKDLKPKTIERRARKKRQSKMERREEE